MDKNNAVQNTESAFMLFKSPKNYYLYSVFLDTVLRISEEIYFFLKNNTEQPLSPKAQEELSALREKKALTPAVTNTIRHPSLDDLQYSLDHKMGQLVLQVTQSCNLVCSYCAYANTTLGTTQRNHSSKKMDPETAKRAIDFYFDHSLKKDRASISFYGGEPLIAFDLLKEIIPYAEDKFLGKKLSFNLTTNGTLLTEDIIDYFVEHKVQVMFSIDGPEKIHDINRKRADGTGSFKAACENLKKMWQKYDKAGISSLISVNMVLNPKNDPDDVFELFDDPFFTENVRVRGGQATEDYLEEKLEHKQVYYTKSTYLYFLCWLDFLNIIGDINAPNLLRSITADKEEAIAALNEIRERDLDTGSPGGPCIPGVRRLFVNTDGDFFPCERVSELDDAMKIGDIRNGFDIKKASDMLDVASLTADKCRSCWAFSHCGVCAKTCVKDGMLSREARLRNCQEQKKRTAKLIREHILYRECKSSYKRGD